MTWKGRTRSIKFFRQISVNNEAKMMEVMVTTGAISRAKAPVKSSPPTNQHPVFYRPDACLVTSPNQQCQSTEGKTVRLE